MQHTPKLIIFGPQRKLPHPEELSRLRLVIVSEPKLVAAIRDLPGLWLALVRQLPELQRVPGPRVFQELKAWINHGHRLSPSQPCTNVLLTPLSVIADIANYLYSLRVSITDQNNSHAAILESVHHYGGFQGLCTGLLAAIAVACSKQEDDIGNFGAVAFRLAVCVGAIVDLEGAFCVPPDEACCLSVRSRVGEEPKMLKILLDFPEAYVSVCAGEACRTVTVSKSSAPLLMQRLSTAKFLVKNIQIEGRFHTPRHQKALNTVLGVCDSLRGLKFPPVGNKAELALTSLNVDLSSTKELHELALRSILIEKADWQSTIITATSRLTYQETADVLAIGELNFVPRSMFKAIKARLNISYLQDFEFQESLDLDLARPSSLTIPQEPSDISVRRAISEHDIAIIGMACRFPGATSIEEYWQLLCEGKSMHREIPSARFSTQDSTRTDRSQRTFWGNFLDNVEEFDHRFFKVSPREAISMDPQQRISLQVAYEAIESSGYFDELPLSKSVGCFLGVSSVDYQENVASHAPSAFSALGTLRAYISGRISHHFGWTGPSITYDTACSSSAVAIHSACQALRSSECSMALAGGVNVMSSLILYQNLSKAGFLSPSGPCKSFDADADGYCRGEGVGLLVLKSLSSAIADGDSIVGVIAGSAVGQSDNSSPITVPNSQSQSDLYRKVTSMADIEPSAVGYVEAHGTGTPVGDPIECESIREVFGDPQRRDTLFFGSVKSNIGHTEAASGAAAVIKAVLMIQKGSVPLQASFNKLNPKIPPLEPNNMEVPTDTRCWNGTAVCVNNYGAAGSNVAMIICKAPECQVPQKVGAKLAVSLKKHALLISAHSEPSLRAYCKTLRQFLTKRVGIDCRQDDLVDALFELAHRANPTLSTSIATTVTSLADLQVMLLDQSESKRSQLLVDPPKRPTVLCFGGQTKAFIGLSEDFYKTVLIFRMHLDRCGSACRSLGVTGFYPGIFSKTPIEDIVLLQCMLFSLQYACAKSWIDCGLQVKAVIGHSVGQLTALCVSGSMSLLHAMQLVLGRATLIRDFWGPERGIMLSVESEYETVRKALSLVNQSDEHRVEIACFNGPSTHILVGSKASIEALESRIMDSVTLSGDMKVRRLDVTHGFHSHLVDPILPRLAELTNAIDFLEPQIQIETCSKDQSWTRIDAEAVTRLSREPVYFSESVNRIAKEKGPCNWIEAGTDSGIIPMARRALDASVQAEHKFQPMSLTSGNAVDLLAEAVVSLWQSGLQVQFWPYHRLQRQEYEKINLPPYQFEKHRHWLDYKEPSATKPSEDQDRSPEPKLLSFVSFIRPQNATQSLAEYMIDPESQDFKTYVQGHKVLGNSSCPASVYIYLAAKSLAGLVGKEDIGMTEGIFCIEQLDMASPLGLNPQRMISLSLESSDHTPERWSFRICSRDSTDTLKIASHASGIAYIETAAPLPDLPLFQDGEDTSIEGSFIYTVFSNVVEYSHCFRGMRKVSARGVEITGIISLDETSAVQPQVGDFPGCDPLMIDNILQVAGLYINCLRENKPEIVYVCTHICKFRLYLQKQKQQFGPWIVLCHDVSTNEKHIMYDIGVFDARYQKTVVRISGARFTGVSRATLTKTLSTLGSTKPSSIISNDPTYVEGGDNETIAAYPALNSQFANSQPNDRSGTVVRSGVQGISKDLSSQINGSRFLEDNSTCIFQLKQLLHSVTGVPIRDMHRSSPLEEIGVDSLMTTEVLGEIEKTFNICITMSEFEEARNLGSLCSLVESKNPQRLRPVIAPAEPVMKSNIMTSLQASDPMNQADDARRVDSVANSFNRFNNESAANIGEKTSKLPDTRFQYPEIFKSFEASRTEFTRIADDIQLSGFTKQVNPSQVKLVVAYIVEAFQTLGCNLLQIEDGDSVSVPHIPRHTALVKQLHQILESATLIHCPESGSVRSATSINESPSHEILERLLHDFPQHVSEHRLLGTMGPHLANCLCGKEDAVNILFGNKASKDLLTDVYTNAPMFATGTRLLASFLSKLTATTGHRQPIRVLEIGGGVGGTTALIIELLESLGHPFTYTFTDISSSLVAAAKKRFTGCSSMNFGVLDVEAEPQDCLLKSKDIIIATNVVHATKSLKESCTNIRKMLDKDGILCLVELTRNLYWFDIVFGPLDGWWRSEDSRKHAVADVNYWEQSLKAAGFEHVVWTGDGSEEGDLVRLIVAVAPNDVLVPESSASEKSQTTMETMLFKYVDRIPLYADIYYPQEIQKTKSKRPIALMIHGGGHVMLSRKDIRPLQLQHLLISGLLPISIDHRLCPELSITSGPMTDLCYALDWARNILPTLPLIRTDIAADGTKVVVIGWSTGGTLAMSLGWTAPARGLKPPEAILVFYCPTDYESEWWQKPHFPWRTSQADAERKYDLWDAVRETPITGYNIASARVPGGWMSTLDARARIPLHMNWTAQTLPILLGALTSEKKAKRLASARDSLSQVPPHDGHSRLPQPSTADIRTISPLAQIRNRNYQAPTYLIHGSQDDFIPWQETQRTYDELVRQGVPAGVRIVDGGGHMFEMLGVPNDDGRVLQSVLDGYRFLFERVGLL